jgi:hypothetical protein
MFYRVLVTLFFTLFSFNTMQAERFLYVNDFKNILDNPSRSIALLAYAQSHQITELILYELHLVNNVHNLSNATTNQILADFIKSAKTNYGITRMSAAGESAQWFQNNIITYNATRSLASEKFDALGLEFEFWTPSAVSMYYCNDYLIPNGLPCDSAGAFAFCKNQLLGMKALAAASSHPLLVEMYVGWPNSGQLLTLSAIADRMFIHAYVGNPATSFTYALTRLNFYSNYTGVANVYIIFSSEPEFMQSWLTGHSMLEAETIFTNAYNASSGTWKSHINFSGFVYFAYTFQTAIVLPINWIKATGKRDGKLIKINWSIKTTDEIDAFELARSIDGKMWENIATLDKNTRQFIDNEGITKAIYYQIKAKIGRGGIETSPIISVESMDLKPQLYAFPNPFNDFINLPELAFEKIELLNNQGQKQLITVENNQIIALNYLAEGIYVLRILMDGTWQQIKMMKSKN